ncbi:MAG: hypothetical protein ABIA04_09385 [Pseudomonadota bacterium]
MHCYECSGFSKKDVRECNGRAIMYDNACPLLPYRMGKGRPNVKITKDYCKVCVKNSHEILREGSACRDCSLKDFRLGKNPNYKKHKKIPNVTNNNLSQNTPLTSKKQSILMFLEED